MHTLSLPCTHSLTYTHIHANTHNTHTLPHSCTHTHSPDPNKIIWYISCWDSWAILLSMASAATVSLGSKSKRNWMEPTEIRPLECKHGNMPAFVCTHIYLLLRDLLGAKDSKFLQANSLRGLCSLLYCQKWLWLSRFCLWITQGLMNCPPDFYNGSCQECPKVLLKLTNDYPSH